ncbi:MAG: RNA polymerase sigma factor [Planctomycetota bacterium]
MQSTDESLINAHCRGDEMAFGELVRRYGGSLLGYLTRMSGDKEQAEDLFQETFKRVHEKAHTFRGSRFKPWLFSIATRVAIDGLRRRRRLPLLWVNSKTDCSENNCGGLDAVTVADNSPNPLEEAAKAEQAENVRQTIELLPTKQRATLVLAYYQQLSYQEVADVLGCSIGTVKVQMYRALRTLARRLPNVSGATE